MIHNYLFKLFKNDHQSIFWNLFTAEWNERTIFWNSAQTKASQWFVFGSSLTLNSTQLSCETAEEEEHREPLSWQTLAVFSLLNSALQLGLAALHSTCTKAPLCCIYNGPKSVCKWNSEQRHTHAQTHTHSKQMSIAHIIYLITQIVFPKLLSSMWQ